MKEYKFKINGNDYAVAILKSEDNTATVSVNGKEYEVEVEGMAVKNQPKYVQPVAVPSTDSHPAVAKTATPAASAQGSIAVKSPLPGVILDIAVREGDSVKIGQKLLVLEAMKMENNIDSDKDGVVKEIKVRKGDSVLEGDVLVVIG